MSSSTRASIVGYDPIKATDNPDGTRTLSEIRLWELSLATFPMNESATVFDVKSLDQLQGVLRGIKASDVDPELLVRLRGIEVELKRLRTPAGDPEADERKAKERVEELEAVRALAARSKATCHREDNNQSSGMRIRYARQKTTCPNRRLFRPSD